MKGEHQVIEESGPDIPAYIVTFSDMVTLLLTFFVMLLSLAKMQDPALFDVGRDSFVRTIRGCGLGMLYGKKPNPDFGKVKTKYFISESDRSYKGRSIDAKEEEIRQIFQKVNRSMTSMPSTIVAQKSNFSNYIYLTRW